MKPVVVQQVNRRVLAIALVIHKKNRCGYKQLLFPTLVAIAVSIQSRAGQILSSSLFFSQCNKSGRVWCMERTRDAGRTCCACSDQLCNAMQPSGITLDRKVNNTRHLPRQSIRLCTVCVRLHRKYDRTNKTTVIPSHLFIANRCKRSQQQVCFMYCICKPHRESKGFCYNEFLLVCTISALN